MMPPNAREELHDWAEIRRRTAAALQATEAAFARENERNVLEARATVLAAAIDEARHNQQPAAAIISFSLSGRRYAIETRFASAVLSIGRMTPLPRTPDFVLGVYDMRGQLLPVFDLRGLLGISADAPSSPQWAIACGEVQPELLIAVDSVCDVAKCPLPSPAEDLDQGRWLVGVTAEGDLMLDGAALLSDRRLFLEDGRGSLSGQRESKS